MEESSEANSFGLGFRLCFPPDLAARRFELLRPDGPLDFAVEPIPSPQTQPVCLTPEHMVRSGGVVNTENMTHFKIRYWEGNVGLTVANVTSVPFRTLPDENDDTGYGYGSEAGVQQLLADGQIGEAFPGGGWRNQLWWDGVPLVADSSRQALRPWEEAFDVRPLSLTSPHSHFFLRRGLYPRAIRARLALCVSTGCSCLLHAMMQQARGATTPGRTLGGGLSYCGVVAHRENSHHRSLTALLCCVYTFINQPVYTISGAELDACGVRAVSL